MIQIGDWVTQYSAGFWMVTDIKPKYAEEDIHDNRMNYKKGDLIGSWILMKKGFTPKMKFRLDSECCDSGWCKPVSPEIRSQIDQYFAEHPKDYEKFCNRPYIDRPAVCPAWINLVDDQVEAFKKNVQLLPETFTRKEAMAVFEKHGLMGCFSRPPANYIFVCKHTLWELDENFDPIFKEPILQKIKES